MTASLFFADGRECKVVTGIDDHSRYCVIATVVALNAHEPFESIADAQAAVDAWRTEYNADRPHQSLGMAFPSARFAPATGEVLVLRVPAAG